MAAGDAPNSQEISNPAVICRKHSALTAENWGEFFGGKFSGDILWINHWSRVATWWRLGVTIWIGEDFSARKKQGGLRGYLVGAARFELTTPCPPDRCANRAAPRPDRNGADYRDAPMPAQQRPPTAFNATAELTDSARLLDVIPLSSAPISRRGPGPSCPSTTYVHFGVDPPAADRAQARSPEI